MTTPGIGLIGCGARLRTLVKQLLEIEPAVRVQAMYDPNPTAIAEARSYCGFGDDVATCDSDDALVGRDDVAWVMIGSRNCDHRANAVKALEAGKHVYCEKPLATTLDDCLAMRDAWRAAGDRQFVMGFTLRFSPFYRKLRELLADGAIGELISFEFNETLDWNHGGFIHGDWRRKRDLAGSHLLEKTCHDIDLAYWMTGSLPRRAASFGGLRFFTPDHRYHVERIGPDARGRPPYACWFDPKFDHADPFTDDKSIVDHQVAIIEYASGVRATFHTNCNTAIPERRMYLLGSEGSIRGDVIEGLIELHRIGWETQRQRIDPGVAGGHGGGDAVLCRELADCMLGGDPPPVGLNEGLISAATCFAIDQAMDEGRVVDAESMWQHVQPD